MYDLNYTNTQYNANINDLFASPKEQNIISEYSKLSIKEILKYMELEMFKYNKKVDFKVKKIKYFTDDMGNPMVYVEYLPFGSAVFSLENFTSLLLSLKATESKIEKLAKNKKYSFNLFTGEFFEIDKDFEFKKNNPLFVSLKKNDVNVLKTLNDKELINSKTQISSSNNKSNYSVMLLGSYVPEFRNFSKEIIKADKEVSHSWWFKTLLDGFGYTVPINFHYDDPMKRGLCHYIASSILIQYSQLFLSQDTLTKEQQEKYMIKPSNSKDNNDKWSYPTGPDFNEKLVYDLWAKYNSHWFATSARVLSGAVERLLNDGRKSPIYVHHRTVGAIRPWAWIDSDQPCLIMGKIPLNSQGERDIHAVVVYGYFDNGNKTLVHFGWPGRSQVIMDSSLYWSWTLIALSPINKKPTIADKSYFMMNNKNIDVEEFERGIQ
ncbi:putative cysteine peptidase [Mycoplasmopsis bovis]|uniref:Uncharacterized protein n=6 Tax=Mycoplasmopsis bovis TaxID=28903 RepID=A0A059Y930_MYCBV|nr:hypothetical protein [Mycoplasmopsis bovis]AEI90343.1 conserved hypothetical protein [Mycoplasmopsis bovis Hubei-1]AFM52021.1 Hypothetical protein Mbov_0671 [Mycoplasmopsis bovis HB0801]AIA34206.1 hypothetical protein K668_03150 [Mycoplasmopsis bovis CQ-W70]AKO50819.1 hypothetical protein AAV31_03325 [Mycoplasmopsis bovis]AMW25223.1 Hypothetical protein BC85_0592 [Mycoplasmopsis bovis]